MFTNRTTRSSKAVAGQVAGNIDHHGYRVVTIKGRCYRQHRLAWFYMHGVWPSDLIDHENRVRSDNRFLNLREASGHGNQRNRKVQASRSGIPGVRQVGEKWRATITVDWKPQHLGMFATADEADAARRAAKEQLHALA